MNYLNDGGENCIMKFKMILTVIICLHMIWGFNAMAKSSSFYWEKNKISVALKKGDHTVWQFNYGTEKDKVFFHPLALTDGTVLTDESHKNHPWHHALWFTWKYINRINFWEEKKKKKGSKGEIIWSDVEISTHPDFNAKISMNLAYKLSDNTDPVLREKRNMIISAPDIDGTYNIDWKSVFTSCSAEDIVLDRTPIEGQEKGKSYGGYAGLSVRFKGTATEIQVHTEKGLITDWSEQRRYNGKAWSMDYSALVDGRVGGIAIFEHPDNLNAPTTWYAIDGKLKYFSPAIIFHQPYTLKAGESMTLNYRITIHNERWEAEVLRGLLTLLGR